MRLSTLSLIAFLLGAFPVSAQQALTATVSTGKDSETNAIAVIPLPRANAESLTRAALIPAQVAASSSSRIATQARPRRDFSKFRKRTITNTSTPSAR